MNNKPPVRIRRNVESYVDPYIDDECLAENTVCTSCGSVYISSRWYLKDEVPASKIALAEHQIVCPACKKQRQKMPMGILTLTGAFIDGHRDEILNLIRNESNKAQSTNPLERIIEMRSSENEMQITTTNETLAQRIGKAIHKAYSGEIEYQFGQDVKLARVNWHRD